MLKRMLFGRREVSPDLPAHVPGVNEGNARGNYEKMSGHKRDGTSTAERSTGINPDFEEPIDPSMPDLSPA